ncbi:hypothetical protein PRK78_001955 [Emydomyces testavorans]|uniref:Protein kinase domain-containing protein n=1 Tax=Emydomyces testavorans TaxID=2070801 RepID=A0AAF0DET7_9EURO|nr:hypothetical protein PRK78_001955 [Emydomyces testavorans]
MTEPVLDPPYEIVHFWCGDKDQTELSVTCYDRRFDILALAANMEECPAVQQEFLRLVADLLSMDDDDFEFIPGQPDPMEEMCYWMAKACFAQLRAFIATHRPEPRMISLEEYYNPVTIPLTLQAVAGVGLTAVQSTRKPEDLTPRVRLSYPVANVGVSLFQLSGVKLFWDAENERPVRPPSRVLVDGEEGMEYFFKPTYHGSSKETEREIDLLLQLQQLQQSPHTIRVPKLHGFVSPRKSRNPTEISGMLLTYIKSCRSLAFKDVVRNAPLSLREKWIQQLQEMINEFHKAGIVWGDAKPANILVDMEDNLWIIDFGGSYTPGWVDGELVETVQGDLQGLSRIIDFISRLGAKTSGQSDHHTK